MRVRNRSHLLVRFGACVHRASHPRQPGSGWEALDDVAQGHAQSAQPGLNWDKHDHLATVPQCIHDPSSPLRHPRCLDDRGLRLAWPPGTYGQGRAGRCPGGHRGGAGGGQVAVKRAIRHCPRGNSAECQHLYSLPSAIAGPRTRSCTGRCGNSGRVTRCVPGSRNEPGKRWGLPAPDSS